MILVCRNIIFCRTEEYKKENGLPPKTAAPASYRAAGANILSHKN